MGIVLSLSQLINKKLLLLNSSSCIGGNHFSQGEPIMMLFREIPVLSHNSEKLNYENAQHRQDSNPPRLDLEAVPQPLPN